MNNWPIQTRLQVFFLTFLFVVSMLLVGTTLNATFQHSNTQLEQRFDDTRQVLQYKFANEGEALKYTIESASKNFSIKQLIASAKDDELSLKVALQNLAMREQASFVIVKDPEFNPLVSTAEIYLPNDISADDINTPDFVRLTDGNIYLVAAIPVKFVERQPMPNAWLVIGKKITDLFDDEIKQLTSFNSFVLDNNNVFVSSNKGDLLESQLMARAQIGVTSFSNVQVQSNNFLVKGYPLSDHKNSDALLFFSTPSSSAYLNFQNLSAQLGIQIIFAVIIAIVLSVLIARGISKPMKEIERGAQKIQQGDYHTKFPRFSMPELNHLAKVFDKMQTGINRREQEIETLAYHSMITELPNRNAYIKHLEAVVTEKKFEQFAVIALDLDRFKVINDTIGHDSGDLLLKAVANRLSTLYLGQSIVSHTDGDEFAFILPFESEQALLELLGFIGDIFKTPFTINNVYLDVNASIGVACYPKHTDEPQKLMQYADIALYQSKQSHKVVELYREDFNHYSVQRLNLMSELRLAIEQDQLSLFYQPKLCLDMNKVVSVESLVRWIHPEHGFIGPDEFIPLAEQTGAIRDLTNWVIEEAISQQRKWSEIGIDLQMSVNISAHDLVDDNIVTMVETLLKEHSVQADRLKIEVTESAIMEDAVQAIDTLNKLKDLGVALSIDDFGTGFSSMSQLRDMPVDELKIDKSFVMDLPDNDGNKSIVTSTVGLAHSLGLSVVAEGVETEVGLSFLKTLGVELAQGYYIAKPLDSDAFELWLKQQN